MRTDVEIVLNTYRSTCSWPVGALPDEVTVTHADHPTFEDAVRGCLLVMQGGFGGKREVFPERLWVTRPDGTSIEVRREAIGVDRPSQGVALANAIEAIRDIQAAHGGPEQPKRGNRRERRAAAARARKAGGEPDVVERVGGTVRRVVSVTIKNRQQMLKALRGK